jgi:phosphorylcholine metabolism protein LicD
MNINLKGIIVSILTIILIFWVSENKIEYYSNEYSLKQKKFKNALEDMAEILNRNNIEFILYCGTALGAHREKKFIEHDKDIDLGIFQNVNIKNIISKVSKSDKFKFIHYFPKNSNIDDIKELSFVHIPTNVKIDFFVIEKKDNNLFSHYSFLSICDEKPNKRCEFTNPINLININFMGKPYRAPDVSFLNSHYGNDWKVVKKFGYSDGLKNGGYKSLK